MISSLQNRERTNRSPPSRGAPMPSAQMSSACFIRVTKRDQLRIARITFRTQTLRRQHAYDEGALRRLVLFFSSDRSVEA